MPLEVGHDDHIGIEDFLSLAVEDNEVGLARPNSIMPTTMISNSGSSRANSTAAAPLGERRNSLNQANIGMHVSRGPGGERADDLTVD